MGAQNIKGTGLDWVYRWVALDRVQSALESLKSDNELVRRRALESLETFEDQGLVDAGLAVAVLPGLAAQAASPEEAARLSRLAARTEAVHEAKRAALEHTRSVGWSERVLQRVEKTLDYLDSVQRRRMNDALMADLVAGRVSHARAALETRKLYERQKGGWLMADLRRFGQDLARLLGRRQPEALPLPGGLPEVGRVPVGVQPNAVRGPLPQARRRPEEPASAEGEDGVPPLP